MEGLLKIVMKHCLKNQINKNPTKKPMKESATEQPNKAQSEKTLYNQLLLVTSDLGPSKCWLYWEPEPKHQDSIVFPWSFPHQS